VARRESILQRVNRSGSMVSRVVNDISIGSVSCLRHKIVDDLVPATGLTAPNFLVQGTANQR
jgi:hypothetical protein